MIRKILILLILAAVAISAEPLWRYFHTDDHANELVLFGNMDLREVALAFNNSERIVEVLAQEGERVKKGQVLARLDTSRLLPQVNKAEAEVEAQKQVVERFHHGSRPEEIAQARANVDAAEADAAYSEFQFHRLDSLSKDSSGRAVSRQDFDNAHFALNGTRARLKALQKALELLVIGPRQEDIKQAEWQLQTNTAQLELLRRQLADADLLAPSDAVVRTRIMEPGEMASPQKPVFSLAIIDPKWVRAYVSETDLGKLHSGMRVSITVDSFENRRFDGWVGFISPVAEFTPKSVETVELRPSLVYEVRAFVSDEKDELKLGMPATVHFPLGGIESQPKSEARH
ncbi:MAG: hypothetical protein DM484_15960 [Candidatus Methylumidiphilus alinenensis]|uniref:Uncharacterized protein n=1 Tax=Candidatus Methylumidiphilus alinenensis TaxID=2202197 RepID=A0A2W4SNN2_9GAMM|nr:MAG: hypothetical protein DM484_15960 [Candidatus Methylumidiphilus alinenensis]